MRDLNTTLFAVCAAVGQILEKNPNVPPWVWTMGQCLFTVGLIGLGASAKDKGKNDPLNPGGSQPTNG